MHTPKFSGNPSRRAAAGDGHGLVSACTDAAASPSPARGEAAGASAVTDGRHGRLSYDFHVYESTAR